MVSIRNPGGLMVRSLDCHAVDPGSILGTPNSFSWKNQDFVDKIFQNSSSNHQLTLRSCESTLKGSLVRLLGLYCVPES